MHKTKTLRRALVVAVCALLTFAIGGVIARAAGDGGWVQAKVNEDGPCSLTIENTMFTDDIGKSDLVVDVYRIAGFDLKLIDTYAATEGNQDLFQSAITSMDDAKMQEFANKLASEVKLTADGTMALTADGAWGTDLTITGLETGVYLVAPHGRGITDGDSLTANSPLYTYTFSANIVSVPPTSLADTGGELRSTVVLKPEQAERYGALRIIKRTVDEAGNPAPVEEEPITFTFHIVGTRPDGSAYDNYAAVTLDPGETEGFDVINHIEAGTTITTVDEVYEGERYDLVGIEVGDKGNIIIADDTIEFIATNTPNGNPPRGEHGVENKLVYDHDGSEGTQGDWNNTATPDDRLVDDWDE